MAKNFLPQKPFTEPNTPDAINRTGPHENYANTTANNSYRTRFGLAAVTLAHPTRPFEKMMPPPAPPELRELPAGEPIHSKSSAAFKPSSTLRITSLESSPIRSESFALSSVVTW